jgi:hypothetical protein
MKTIDKYKEKIFIRFDKGGDSFAGITKLPHYKVWIKILKHLKKRGFEIHTPKYFSEQKYGQHEHKVAYKGDVVFCLECMSSQIEVQFGDVKNLWKDWEFNFWSLTDDRSKPLTYLEAKRIELEVNKLISIFPQEKIVENERSKFTGEQFIIKNKKDSCRSYHKEKLDELGLDGVVYQMSDYDHSQNSSDRDKKKINCGELKYFYGYGKRLKCGKIYHNINNMWWVLLPCGNVDNISSFKLFDFNGESRRKELTKEEKINRLEKELKKHESNKNYIRCISINRHIEKMKGSEKLYNVWSLKWGKWWGDNNSGYTSDKRYAGVYLEENIMGDQSYYNNGVSTKAVLI